MGFVDSVRIKKSKWLIPIIAILIILGTYSRIFALAALLCCILVVVISNNEDSMCCFMFILPYASIFKMSPEAQSFFTYVILFYVLYMGITKRKINKSFLIAIAVFFVFLLFRSFLSLNIMRLVKFIANIFLIYGAMHLNIEKSHKSIFLSYILGVLTSSLVVYSGFFTNITDYVSTKGLGLSYDWLARFSGFYGDPNYYVVNVILSMCLVVALWHRKEMNTFLAAVLIFVFVYFAIITYSKSAILMLFVPMLLFVYSNFNHKKYFWSVIFAVVLLYAVFLAITGQIDILSTVMSRFQQSSGDITTGRTDIWNNYFKFFAENPVKLLIGNGMGAELIGGMAPHNTYIDFLYYFGVIGTILIIILMIVIPKPSMKRVKRNLMNYGNAMCIMAMYFFLSETYYVDLAFHIILVMMMLYLPINRKRDSNGEQI